MAVADALEENPPYMYICTVIGKSGASPETAKKAVSIFWHWEQPVTAIVVQELIKPA